MTGATYDAAFAHAVRLAATGLRTKAEIDPAMDATPFAAIMRGDGPLHAEGLELLAQLVTGKLRAPYGGKMPEGESGFAHAVRKAGMAWRDGKGMDPAVTGAPLAAYLRDEHWQIGDGERALLAEMLCPTPALRPKNEINGRFPKGVGTARVQMILALFKSERVNTATDADAIALISKRRALHDGKWYDKPINHTDPQTGEVFTVTERTVKNYLKMEKEHNAEVHKAIEQHDEREKMRQRKRKIKLIHDRKTTIERIVANAKASSDK